MKIFICDFAQGRVPDRFTVAESYFDIFVATVTNANICVCVISLPKGTVSAG